MAMAMSMSMSTTTDLHNRSRSYNDLPHEIKLHIFSFLDLETLVDSMQYIDKFHRTIVSDILKNYTLTNQDCNSFWFEHIKNQKTLFLHAHLKPQLHSLRIKSIDPLNQEITTITWFQYLSKILKFSIEKNSYLYIIILVKNFINKACINNSNWYLSKYNGLLINHIKYAIRYNSLNIINFLLQNKNISLTNETIVEQQVKFNMFYSFAIEAILYNKVNILIILSDLYNYTNEQYNMLLVECASNKTIDKAIFEKKDNVIDFILQTICSKDTNDSIITEHTITQFINNALQDKIYNVNNVNNILYFINKLHNQISINNYKIILTRIICSQNIINFSQTIINFKYIFALYSHKYDIFPNCTKFTKEDLISEENTNTNTNTNTNITTLISNIKSSLLYECFITSIKNDHTEILLFLKDILIKNCILYNLTQDQFVKYLILDCIEQTKFDKSNKERLYEGYITHDIIYNLLFQNLTSIYNLENIISIMNIISSKSVKENYHYFLTLFLNKQVLTKKIYINLLKHNLYLSILHESCNTLTEYILLKLKQIGENYLLNDDKYTPIFLNFIKNKRFKNIEFMLTNGYIINEDALLIAVKIKSINIIKLLITNGANIDAHNYSVLHFALKLPKITLAAFIKIKLIAENKDQLYINWETNLDLKTKFISMTI